MDISPAALSQNIALFQSQVLGPLFGSSDAGASDLFSTLLDQRTKTLKSDGATTSPLAPSGRNLALFDPDSAYNMMSFINSRDALYKAQFAELDDMKSGVARMQVAGLSLGGISSTTPASDIEAQLQRFVGEYNDWRASFGADVQDGGLLDNVQAAEVSLYELEQSVKNIFFGAKDGVHGLGDLGVAIDANTGLATLDGKKLDAMLNADRNAAVGALHDFSANFAKSAGLLNSEKNFIPNQLDNLSRAIHYIADNKDAWMKEFGTGDSAHPAGQVARALAAYNQAHGLKA